MMKNGLILLITTVLTTLACTAQELPQFNSSDFDGWIYNNPGIALSQENIAGNKICLYVNSDNLALTLISPVFSCEDIDTINAQVKWITRYFYVAQFVLGKTALTIALDDAQGNPMDSVTRVPTTPGTSTHMLDYSIPVPPGLKTARLRLVSWSADKTSCGAVNRVTLSGVTTTPVSTSIGDLDGDGNISVSDVTMLIELILNGSGNADLAVADVDLDGNVSVSDVTMLINRVLNGIWALQ